MLKLTVILIGLCVSAQGASKIPESWKVCKLSDSDLNGCLKTAIQGAITDLMPGNPSLGADSLDPLTLKRVAIEKGSGPVSIDLELSGLTFENLKYIEINTLENDWKTMKATLTLPKGLRVMGKYRVDGQVLVLPIKGEGDVNIVLDNVAVDCKLIFEEKLIDGKTHYQVNRFGFNFEPSHLHIKLTGLFGGDKALGDNMNKFLNDNWQVLLAEMKRPIADALSKDFIVITNHIFNKITKDEISPA